MQKQRCATLVWNATKRDTRVQNEIGQKNPRHGQHQERDTNLDNLRPWRDKTGGHSSVHWDFPYWSGPGVLQHLKNGMHAWKTRPAWILVIKLPHINFGQSHFPPRWKSTSHVFRFDPNSTCDVHCYWKMNMPPWVQSLGDRISQSELSGVFVFVFVFMFLLSSDELKINIIEVEFCQKWI